MSSLLAQTLLLYPIHVATRQSWSWATVPLQSHPQTHLCPMPSTRNSSGSKGVTGWPRGERGLPGEAVAAGGSQTWLASSPSGSGAAPNLAGVLAQWGEQRWPGNRTAAQQTKFQATEHALMHRDGATRPTWSPGSQGRARPRWVTGGEAEGSRLEGEGKKAGTCTLS